MVYVFFSVLEALVLNSPPLTRYVQFCLKNVRVNIFVKKCVLPTRSFRRVNFMSLSVVPMSQTIFPVSLRSFFVNRPFSYSEKESQSNDTLLHFVDFLKVHNSDRNSNAT